MQAKTSPAVEDYLKAIQALEWRGGRDGAGGDVLVAVATTDVADRLGVSAASATSMLKRLASMGLVVHAPYKGATLTDPGRKIALEVIRHHRLLETYLAEALGVPWDRVHEEAEILEHVLSEDLEDRIAALLGDPKADPHGHPIPSKDGSMPAPSRRSLWDLDEGERAVVERVSDERPDALRYLADAGIRPGAEVTVTGRGPVAGPLLVGVKGSHAVHPLSKELSEDVWVV